jgi:broad specificity phosphatase PhoE
VTRLVLIRHGQSVANAARRFTLGPEEPLSPLGRSESLAVGRRLRERFDPVAIYTSPFVRALETARLIAGCFGLEPIVVPELREQHYGDLHGLSYDVLARDLASAAAQVGGAWRLRPPGGETLEEVAQRVAPALAALAARHLGQEVIVVSHGGVMAALRTLVTGGFTEGPVVSANADGYVLRRLQDRWLGPFALDE